MNIKPGDIVKLKTYREACEANKQINWNPAFFKEFANCHATINSYISKDFSGDEVYNCTIIDKNGKFVKLDIEKSIMHKCIIKIPDNLFKL